jgi:putative phage-type endonuclease
MSAQWHELRAQNIGGSEVAALFGKSPFMSRLKLWQIKSGAIVADDLSGNETVQAGAFLEKGILPWACQKYNLSMPTTGVYVRHQQVFGMACTPDAWNQETQEIMQIKVAFSRQKWKIFEDDIIEAPLHYIMQCQHEMACTGSVRCHLVVFFIGTGKLLRLVIERDNDLIAILENEVEKFWNSINTHQPPEPDYEQDGATIQAIRNAQAKIAEPIDMSGNNQLYNAGISYLEAKQKADAAESAKHAAKNEILRLAEGAKKIIVNDISISIVDNGGSPDKIITPEMVGQTIKGRAPYSYPLVTNLKGS